MYGPKIVKFCSAPVNTYSNEYALFCIKGKAPAAGRGRGFRRPVSGEAFKSLSMFF